MWKTIRKPNWEYIGSDLYEIVARYVEIDGKPYVMEMAHQVEEELIIEREGIDLSGNVKDSLFDKLYIDALSGAYNRRYFEDCVRNKIVNAGIAMLDLDDFKVSNAHTDMIWVIVYFIWFLTLLWV